MNEKKFFDMWVKPADNPDAPYQKLGSVEETMIDTIENGQECSANIYYDSKPITISCEVKNTAKFKAFCIYAVSGNDLYLRFPKKLRRKRGWL